MESSIQGRYIPKALSAGALLWELAACAEPSVTHQQDAMQEMTSADLQREQVRVAAVSDAALPSGSAPMMTWDGHPALQPGAEHTPGQLFKQIEALAHALRAQADSDPDQIERILGIALPPDAKNERRGVSGKVGQGRYDWGVWKASPKLPGHRVELTLTPKTCLACDVLKKQFAAAPCSFRADRPTYRRPGA